MNVAILIQSGTISGAEKRALKIINELNSKERVGYKFLLFINKILFTKYSESEYKKLLPSNTVIVDDYSIVQNLIILLLFRKSLKVRYKSYLLNKLLANYNVDIIHVFLGLGTARSITRKVIFEITSSEYNQKINNLSIEQRKGIDHYNAVSDSTYKSAVSTIPAADLTQAPIPFFDPTEYIISEELLFEQKENRIIFAHRLIPRKNGMLFAHVVKKLLNSHSDWEVMILGTGQEEDEIRLYLREEILSGRVVMKYTPDVLREMKKAKICVSIIQPDNYPSQSVLEAMYTKNALLLSDEGSTRTRFFSDNGRMCKITFESVYENLEYLISNQTLLKEMGKNSLRLLNERFHKKAYIDYLLNMYSQVHQKESL